MDQLVKAQGCQQDCQGFAKGHPLLWLVAPTESPNIMGLEGIHSPEALQWCSRLSLFLWCRKEGQNEGMVVNHL